MWGLTRSLEYMVIFIGFGSIPEMYTGEEQQVTWGRQKILSSNWKGRQKFDFGGSMPPLSSASICLLEFNPFNTEFQGRLRDSQR